MLDLEERHDAARARTASREDDLLPLPSNGEPKTVFVARMEDGRPGFACRDAGPYHPDGMMWRPDAGIRDDLFITFVLKEGISSVEKSPHHPTIFLSALFVQGTHQDACAPMVSAPTATYHFCVIVDGRRVDPKIVVTPQ